MRTTKFNGSFLSLLFSGVITTGIIVAVFVKTFPLLAAKTLYFCQQFISNNLFQISHTIPATLLLTFITALILGSLSFFIQVWKTKRLVRRLLKHRISLSKKAENIATSLGIAKKVYIVKDKNMYSFCAGILQPKILITTTLASSLSNRELEAVFLHEKAHIKNHDPLKLLFGKTVSWLFFFLPVFSQLYKNMEGTNELLADHWTIAKQEEATFLRGALKKILAVPQLKIATVPAVANPDHLEIRIQRIVNPKAKHNFGISSLSIITSSLFIILSWVVLQTPVGAFHSEDSSQPSYFLCSADNACRQECNFNAQKSAISNPEYLFSSERM